MHEYIIIFKDGARETLESTDDTLIRDIAQRFNLSEVKQIRRIYPVELDERR